MEWVHLSIRLWRRACNGWARDVIAAIG